MSRTQQLLVSVQRELGEGVVDLCNQGEKIEVISTGFAALNQALGIGGYPRGRIVEVFGGNSAGKSLLVLHALREAQQGGKLAALIDADRSFDAKFAQAIGLDLDRLLVSRPEHAEQALDLVELLARSGEVSLIAIDSVPALATKAETEGRMGDNFDGQQARLLALALRKLTGVAHKTGTTLVLVNQMRHASGVMFGSQETTTGGNALKHYASLRLDVRRLLPLKEGEQIVGQRARVSVVKNKLGVPFGEAELELKWGSENSAAS